jgi:amidase/aspartyl-tRNA(Asn)/glutamyl-tRNA(Gln) amidotransferase subunit A
MRQDLIAARGLIQAGRATALQQLEACVTAAVSARCEHVFLSLDPEGARRTAAQQDAQVDRGAAAFPLGGLAVSVKDLFDVRGEVTTAASRVLAGRPAATDDCPAVARLRRAGAALIGRTNMSEFAFSGVGINPHHGTPRNPATAALDPSPRIPGGSTSGGAVSVAAGAAWAALGSDTGGSLRIPAALNGLVGYKCTARLTPTTGAIPLSTTLDTVGAITRSVRDAALMHSLLSDRRVTLADKPASVLRLAVPHTLMLDGLEPTVAQAFERALGTLRNAGAVVEEIEMPELAELATINATGGFSPAEAWAWHRRLLAERGDQYDPRVAARIRRGEGMSAADYIDLLSARRDWITRVERRLQDHDAMLSPTVPIVAPLLEPLIASDEAFFSTNATLLRNPAAINMLDGCAISLPCNTPGDWPVGLMVWSSALRDAAVLDAAQAIEAALAATH